MTAFGGCRVGGVATHSMFVNGDLRGKFIMDRNLGARDTSFASEGKGALMYQFGRKDPFAGGTSGNVTTAYKECSNEFWEINNDSSTGVPIYISINNPMLWYLNEATSYNWCSGVNSEVYIWNDFETDKDNNDKSIFDPSPYGWKVSPHGTLINFTTETMSEWNNGSEDGQYGRSYLLADDKFAYYPAYSWRWSVSGALGSYSTQINMWTSTPTSITRSYCLEIRSDGTMTTSYAGQRAHGMPIRCVQHDE